MAGKNASDLQSNISINNGVISGTLKYISDYSSAFTEDEKSGYFLALKATPENGAVTTVQVIGGLHGASTLDADGLAVLRIIDTNEYIQYVSTKSGKSETYNFSLAGILFAD